MAQLEIAKTMESLDLNEFKRQKLSAISIEIQSKISSLQNIDVSKCLTNLDEKLLCSLNKNPAFAPAMHHIAWCLIYGFY